MSTRLYGRQYSSAYIASQIRPKKGSKLEDVLTLSYRPIMETETIYENLVASVRLRNVSIATVLHPSYLFRKCFEQNMFFLVVKGPAADATDAPQP
jgi:hypothetical protein